MSRHYIVNGYSVTPSPHTLKNIRDKFAVIYISFANPKFYGRKMETIVNFANENFDNVMILSSGQLYRHSYVGIQPVESDLATGLALAYERRYIREELTKFQPLFDSGKFQLRRWVEFCYSAEFAAEEKKMRRLYESSPSVRAEIDEFSQSFLLNTPALKRQIIPPTQTSNFLKLNKESGIQFILEELAMMALLAENGYPVILYPGTIFSLLGDLIAGKYPLAPEGLRKSIQLTVDLKRMGGVARKSSRLKHYHAAIINS